MFRKTTNACVFLAAFFLASSISAIAATYGQDETGHPVTSLGTQKTRAIVLVFLASDCPISNRYLPELKRLNGEFAQKDVAFWLVYPNFSETAARGAEASGRIQRFNAHSAQTEPRIDGIDSCDDDSRVCRTHTDLGRGWKTDAYKQIPGPH